MISTKESKALKEKISGNYIAKISMYFHQHMIFNKFDEPFSTSYLSRVINGKQPNKKVEAGLMKFVQELNAQEEQEAKRRAKILGIDKTYAHAKQ